MVISSFNEHENSPYSGKALKRNAWDFFTGKAFSALFTFVQFLWLVRLLTIVEYGAYVSLVAGVELAWGFADLGLHWMAARYLPEFRLNGSGRNLIKLVIRLIAWYTASLVLIASLIFLFLENLLFWVALSEYHAAALLYLVVFIVEGLGCLIRESLLGSLLQQRLARTILVLRLLTFLVLLNVFVSSGSINLVDVARAELGASLVGLLAALAGTGLYLDGLRKIESKLGWQEPRITEMWKMSMHMYCSHLISLLYSHQVFVLFIKHFLGAEASAVFGFMRGLYEQISRYLPASLLFSLIRPKLVAGYVGGGGIQELSTNVNLVGKLSFFVLIPLVAIVCVDGDNLITFLSGDKFFESGNLFLGFMLALIPFSQRQLLETVAVTTGKALLCTYGSASGILILPLMYILLQIGLGLWAPIIAFGAGNLIFNGIIVIGMVKSTSYKPDNFGLFKILAAALLSTVVTVWIPAIEPVWLHVCVVTISTLLLYLSACWLNKPFTEIERNKLNGIINRRLFIW